MQKAQRSLRVRKEYIGKVKQAVRRNRFPTQRYLAEELNLCLSTVSNYLNGKPVFNLNFMEISEKLGIDWEEIADWDELEILKY
jgi:serine/threonine-protein kinase